MQERISFDFFWPLEVSKTSLQHNIGTLLYNVELLVNSSLLHLEECMLVTICQCSDNSRPLWSVFLTPKRFIWLFSSLMLYLECRCSTVLISLLLTLFPCLFLKTACCKVGLGKIKILYCCRDMTLHIVSDTGCHYILILNKFSWF